MDLGTNALACELHDVAFPFGLPDNAITLEDVALNDYIALAAIAKPFHYTAVFNVMKSLQTHSRSSYAGVTLVELSAIIALIAIIMLLLLPWSRWSAEARRNACAGNLKQMGHIFSVYASESPGNRYPPKAPNCFAPDIATLYPDYMTDLMPLVCSQTGDFDVLDRTNPDGWYHANGSPRMETVRQEGDASYAYTGFAIPNNTWIAPVRTRQAMSSNGTVRLFGNQIQIDGAVSELLAAAFANPHEDANWSDHPNPNVKDAVLYRIHRGVELILADEGHLAAGNGALSRLSVMWDNLFVPYDSRPPDNVVFNHEPKGSNVLFLDGHVEFVEYGSGRFPVTDEYVSMRYGANRSR